MTNQKCIEIMLIMSPFYGQVECQHFTIIAPAMNPIYKDHRQPLPYWLAMNCDHRSRVKSVHHWEHLSVRSVCASNSIHHGIHRPVIVYRVTWHWWMSVSQYCVQRVISAIGISVEMCTKVIQCIWRKMARLTNINGPNRRISPNLNDSLIGLVWPIHPIRIGRVPYSFPTLRLLIRINCPTAPKRNWKRNHIDQLNQHRLLNAMRASLSGYARAEKCKWLETWGAHANWPNNSTQFHSTCILFFYVIALLFFFSSVFVDYYTYSYTYTFIYISLGNSII